MYEHTRVIRTRGINLCSADSFGLVWVKYVGTLGDGVLRPEAAACIQWPESGSAAQSGNTRHRGNTLWGAKDTKLEISCSDFTIAKKERTAKS